MFATIRRHQKWLWLVVIVGVIVPFVIFLDPSYSFRKSGPGGRRVPRGAFGYVNGRPIEADELQQLMAEARIQFFFYAQAWPEQNDMTRQMFDPERRVPERLLLVEKMRELGVVVSNEAVADWIAQVFRDPETGKFSRELYRGFVERGLPSAGLTEADFQRFARHEVGIRHLYSLGAVSGTLISPREAGQLFRLENETVSAEIALFSLTNYLAQVNLTPEALGAFFTNQEARYRIPEMIQVSYVRFPATNHLAEVDQLLSQRTNLTEQIDKIYRQRGADAFKDKANVTMSEAQAKETIRNTMREQLSLAKAQEKAMSFAEQLFSQYEKEPAQLDNLERLAAALGLPAAVTDPFPRSRPPANLDLPADFASTAFDLSTNQPMSTEPLIGEESVYVITFKQRYPSRPSTIEEAKQKNLEADFRQFEARRLALQAARSFYEKLTAGLAQNQSFAAICAASSVPTIKPPPFARSTRSLPDLAGRLDLGQLQSVALQLQAGQVSDLKETRDGAMVVYVASRTPVEESRLQAELPAFLEEIRSEQQRQAVNEWLSREMELAQISGLPDLGSRRRSQSR